MRPAPRGSRQAARIVARPFATVVRGGRRLTGDWRAGVAIRGRELDAYLRRHLTRRDGSYRPLAGLAGGALAFVGGGIWLSGSRRGQSVTESVKELVKEQVADEVGVVARDVLAAKRLQHELCNVSNRTFHKIVDRLIADPRTTVAAIDFLVKVLEQPGAVDASRDLILGVVNDTKTADTMGELFVRVGGKEGTKDAVVTVFTNCFADADAHKQGVDWLRRVITSEPVVGTCGGEAHEQVSRALGSQKVWASIYVVHDSSQDPML